MNKADLVYISRLYKLFKPFYSGMGHVLMFHRVGKNEDQVFTGDLQVSPEFLEITLSPGKLMLFRWMSVIGGFLPKRGQNVL
jgi:hypothetical protein